MTKMTESKDKQWVTVCNTDDLVNDSGICALLNDTEQVAIFKLPNSEEQIFAIGNFDPIGKANVISRGIVGCIGGEPVVASPLYKQHFSLKTGRCLQEEQISLNTFPVRIEQTDVQVFI
jgi:nitrite reductase (NADH) small subunit